MSSIASFGEKEKVGILVLSCKIVEKTGRGLFCQEETFRLNKAFCEKLVPTMEKTGVMVLVENVGIADNNGRCYMNSAQRLLDFLDYFDHPLLGICWDIGHANVFGSQHGEIVKLGKHLQAIHYNDNDRKSDLHTSPFLSTYNVFED